MSTNIEVRNIVVWGGTPASSVVTETAYGQSSAVWVGTAYARDDHTHGTPALPTKAQVGLGNVDNTSDLNKPVSTATQTALNAKQDTSAKDAVNGYAGLDAGGKINQSQLPAIAITDTFPVASQVAQLALTAEVGDLAVRTDINKTYILRVSPATTFANWQELLTPTDSVQSVFSRSGVVTAQAGDYTATQITNTPAGNIAATNVQTALNELDSEKAAIGHTHLLANITDVTMTVANLNSLDDWVNTALHFHDADRARASHTGTQLSATISDFASSVNSLITGKQDTSAKDATGGYVGLTLFKINFKNVLNTFTSFFTNSNTAARTYTFQDRDGTIADNTDLALKANLASPTFTGTVGLPAGQVVNGVTLSTAQGIGNFLRGDGTYWAPAGGGDMVLASIQTVSGLKTFLSGAFALRNVANTFSGLFTNTNTADRTYTLKDASGTLAFISDITGTNSGTNTGDNAVNSLYSGLVSNATHTGDATGATALTLATVNSNVGTFGLAGSVAQFVVNAKGLITSSVNVAISITASQVSDFSAGVRAVTLTGLSLATSQVIASTDTVLLALGYLQAQITALTTTVSGKQNTITLTTTGTSGAATLIGATLNIPNYASGGWSGITRSISSISTNTSAGATATTDYVYICTATLSLTLPTAVGNTNQYTVKNIGGTTTIATTSAQTIDGWANTVLSTQYNSLDFVSDWANWIII